MLRPAWPFARWASLRCTHFRRALHGAVFRDVFSSGSRFADRTFLCLTRFGLRGWRAQARQSREIAAHRLEVELFPTALLIAHVAVRYIAVDQRKPSAFSDALQVHCNRGVGIRLGKSSRAPGLNDALTGHEFDIGTRNVSIPGRDLRVGLARHHGCAAGHGAITASIEPRPEDRLRVAGSTVDNVNLYAISYCCLEEHSAAQTEADFPVTNGISSSY